MAIREGTAARSRPLLSSARARHIRWAVAALSLALGTSHARDALPHDGLVKAAMTARYGAAEESPAPDCWRYLHPEYGRYCVRPVKEEWIGARGARRLYLLAGGVPMRADGTIDPSPAHVLPGLVGAFLVTVDASGRPKFLAGTDAFMFGSFGESGAVEARLVKVGSDYHAWVFSSGGTWQGVSVGWYHILAPRGDRFVDLSKIPTIREEDQAHRYSIEFVPAPSHVYALTVTQLADAADTKPRRFVVPFNYRDWRYGMPRGPSTAGER
jgi:hypothetical protein